MRDCGKAVIEVFGLFPLVTGCAKATKRVSGDLRFHIFTHRFSARLITGRGGACRADLLTARPQEKFFQNILDMKVRWYIIHTLTYF